MLMYYSHDKHNTTINNYNINKATIGGIVTENQESNYA